MLATLDIFKILKVQRSDGIVINSITALDLPKGPADFFSSTLISRHSSSRQPLLRFKKCDSIGG